ncbi:MAG: hypothetical protein ACXVP0_12940 [Bacteroidia bacterium]
MASILPHFSIFNSGLIRNFNEVNYPTIKFLSLYNMKPSFKYLIVFAVILGISMSCRTHRDCGGRKKRKVKTEMGGYM